MHKNIQQKVPPHDIIDLMDITMQRLVIQALRVADRRFVPRLRNTKIALDTINDARRAVQQALLDDVLRLPRVSQRQGI